MAPFPHHYYRQPAIRFLIVLTLLFSFSCFHEYYKVRKSDLETFRKTVNTGKIKKTEYFVLHQGDTSMHLTDLYFEGDQLHGKLSQLPPQRAHDPTTYTKPVRYRPPEKYILQETHILLQENVMPPLEYGPVTIPVSAIAEIDHYDKDTGMTIVSHVIGVAGVAAPIIIGGLIAADNSYSGMNVTRDPVTGEITSCPYVAAYDGQVFRLQGESFAGAIFPALERHDYLPLPDIRPVNNGYQVRISNEQKEIQHINQAELIIVEHPDHTSVLLDQYGTPHSLQAPQSPERALAPNGRNLQTPLLANDQRAYLFDEGDLLQNYADLSFAKPADSTRAKLVLSARSSYWAVLMFEAYTERFGTDYQHWADQMKALPASALYDMMDKQGMRLAISLYTNGLWQAIDHIDNIGPLAFRQVVIPIDLTTHRDEEVRIKVEGGHLLWELDYAALDFTPDTTMQLHRIPPGSAIASDEQDYTQILAADDQQYLHQSYGGHHVTIWYPAPHPRKGFRQSVFLHSKGHYDHIKQYEHPPELDNLPDLREPGSFIEFSKRQHRLLVGR